MEKKIEKTKLNIEQLNMEQVATKIATNSNKEEKAMKGRKFLVLLTTIILVASMMVACGSDTSANQSASNKDNNQDEIQVDDPVEDETDVAEPDEDETDVTVPDEDETTPDEDVVDPEPVEEDNPNIIKGYDFTGFNENDKTILSDMKNISSEKLMWIVVVRNSETGEKKVVDVLCDGDSYEMSADENMHYSLSLYIPNEIDGRDSVSVSEGDVFLSSVDVTDGNLTESVYVMGFNSDVFENAPATTTVTYADESTESITVYLTRQ